MKAVTYYDPDAIADAVRRDMRREMELAQSADGYAHEHAYNVHKAKQILEFLKPKHITR